VRCIGVRGGHRLRSSNPRRYEYFAEYRVERFHGDVKATDMYEGTTEINKNVVVSFLLRWKVLGEFMLS
jgi:alkylation response protein AidB-like acyl-CoA dehydrogenase